MAGGDATGVRAPGPPVPCRPGGDLGLAVALGGAAVVAAGEAGRVADGEVAGLAGGVGVGRAAYGEGVGPAGDVPGLLLAVGVSVGPSAGGSVGIGGRGSGDPPVSLAPFRGGDTVATGEGGGEGMTAGEEAGLGVVPGGQRLQVRAQ